MNSKKIEFTVGLFVLAGLLCILYLAVSIGGSRFFGGDARVIEARFSNIGGLNPGSNVMIAGVKIGSVQSISLDEQSLVAVVQMKLDSTNIEVYDDAIASIRTNGLIGDKYIAFDPGASGIELEEDEPIVDTESALDIESLISRFAFGDIGGGEE
ncbi:outer membrane lipid asymmetry maintenance protein MlaD [Puniceicoccaceae bacterium K14]|nr:outer membrane lipid asymmetry maintenance protein MlaD [Puniceicoccaceae bacterium K14]